MTVVGNHIARLRRLEAAIAPASRWFIVRERDGDIEGQVQRLRDEEGLTDRDPLMLTFGIAQTGIQLADAKTSAPSDCTLSRSVMFSHPARPFG
jgi:hypothetical protein